MHVSDLLGDRDCDLVVVWRNERGLIARMEGTQRDIIAALQSDTRLNTDSLRGATEVKILPTDPTPIEYPACCIDCYHVVENRCKATDCACHA